MGVGQAEILWNLSENVGEEDLNNMQRFQRAVMMDWMYGQSGSFQGVDDVGAAGFSRTVACWVLGDSAAPYPSATTRQITHLGGPIGQWKSGPVFPLASNNPAVNWGRDPYFLQYWLSPGELATTHAVGDAVNPRWDLVSVQLNDVSNDVADEEARLQKQEISGDFVVSTNDFIKRRKVTITAQLTVGTPAASPTIPAAPAGHVPFYAVLVPANHNAVFTVDAASLTFFDYRMPVGSFCADEWAKDSTSVDPSLGTFTYTRNTITSVIFGAGIQIIDIVPRVPVSSHSCRLIGVSALSGHRTTQFIVNIGRAVGIGPPLTTGPNLTGLGSGGVDPASGAGQFHVWNKHRLTNNSGNSPLSTTTPPVWGNGMSSGYAMRRERSTAENTAPYMVLRYAGSAAGAEQLAQVRFHFAGMPY